jgi:hypothetical protein
MLFPNWISEFCEKKRRFVICLYIYTVYTVSDSHLELKRIDACIRIRGICLNCMWRSGLMSIGNSFNHQKSQCLGVIPCCEGSCLELYWLLLFHQARNTNPQRSTTIQNYPMYHENLRNVPGCWLFQWLLKFLEMSSIIMIHQYSSYNMYILHIYTYDYDYKYSSIYSSIICIYSSIFIMIHHMYIYIYCIEE